MRGRPPIPTTLKLITGQGRRPLPKAEPKPACVIPTFPKALQGEARREWYRVSRELHMLGLLTKVDRGALVAYCLAWARLLAAEEALAAEGPVVDGRQEGKVKNPWVTIQVQAADMIRKFSVEFGLTPASRCRLKVPETKRKSIGEIAAERAAENRKRWSKEGV